MIDGKEFFADDPNIAMKNLPVNIIDKVRAYDKQSDLARAQVLMMAKKKPFSI